MSSEKHNRFHRAKVGFADIIALLWLNKYKVLAYTLGMAVLFGVIAFSLPKEYGAMMTMMPEEGKKGGSDIGAMMGLAVGGTTDDAYTLDIYPDIVQSIPFIVGLFDVELQNAANDSTFTLRQILEERTRQAWFMTLIPNFSSEDEDVVALQPIKGDNDNIVDPFRLTKAEMNLIKAIRARITVGIDKKTGLVDIGCQLQDPLSAAQLVDTVAARLQEYITDYRTAKARHDLDYALTLNENAKREYYEAQQRFADYQDANQGLATYSASTTRDRLENEMRLAFNTYNQTCQRVQAAENTVQDSTPIFAVVEPSTVPLLPTSPRKKLLVAVGLVLGFFIGACVVLYKPFIGKELRYTIRRDRKEQEREKEEQREERAEHREERSGLSALLSRMPWLRRKKDDEAGDEDEGNDSDDKPDNPEDAIYY